MKIQNDYNAKVSDLVESKPLPEEEGLEGYARAAASHWRIYRPKMYADLKMKGKLRERLEKAGREASDQVEKLSQEFESKGLDPTQAHLSAEELVLPNLIYLPSEDDQPNLSDPPLDLPKSQGEITE